MKVETKDGRIIEVLSDSIDDHRCRQLAIRWIPAGTLFCYLGLPNPFGFGRAAELTEVRLIEEK